MKTKYVCRGIISLYVNFHNNRTMWSTNLHVKICSWGGGVGVGGKEKKPMLILSRNDGNIPILSRNTHFEGRI